jgi:dihydrofolate reductase
MRKLSASLFMSLDGVVDSPQDWHFPYMDDQMMAAIAGTMASTDTILLGRVTFQEWAAYWPHQAADGGMADHINTTPKYVASTTLEKVDWDNSAVIDADLAATVADLKNGSGSDISVTGSGTLVRSLLELDLVDELRLMIHPVVVGRGKRLFADGNGPRGLALVSSETFRSGVLNLIYAPADGHGAAA